MSCSAEEVNTLTKTFAAEGAKKAAVTVEFGYYSAFRRRRRARRANQPLRSPHAHPPLKSTEET